MGRLFPGGKNRPGGLSLIVVDDKQIVELFSQIDLTKVVALFYASNLNHPFIPLTLKHSEGLTSDCWHHFEFSADRKERSSK